MRMRYPRQSQIASLSAVTVGVATRHRIAVHEARRNKSIYFVHGRASVVEKDVSAGRPQRRRFLVTTDEVRLVEVCAPVTERTDPDSASIICDIQCGLLVSHPSGSSRRNVSLAYSSTATMTMRGFPCLSQTTGAWRAAL
jgi:hypothetical protein